VAAGSVAVGLPGGIRIHECCSGDHDDEDAVEELNELEDADGSMAAMNLRRTESWVGWGKGDGWKTGGDSQKETQPQSNIIMTII
jgi:hypothetical protein